MGCGATKQARENLVRAVKVKGLLNPVKFSKGSKKENLSTQKKDKEEKIVTNENAIKTSHENSHKNKVLLNQYLDRVTYKLEVDRKELKKKEKEVSKNENDIEYPDVTTGENMDTSNNYGDKMSNSLLRKYLKHEINLLKLELDTGSNLTPLE